jgi:hypothetical protein
MDIEILSYPAAFSDEKALVIFFISFSDTGWRKTVFENCPDKNDLTGTSDVGIFLASEGPILLK